MGIKSLVKNVLTEQQNKKYARLLATKAVTYDHWIRERESACTGEKGAVPVQKEVLKQDTSQGLEIHSEEEYVCICMPGGQPAEGAGNRIAQWFVENPKCQILYGDEDIIAFEYGADGAVKSSVRKAPWFKPDWSPDLLKCSFYFGSMVALRKELWARMFLTTPKPTLEEVGLEQCTDGETENRSVFCVADIASFQNFIRSCVTEAGAYQKNSKAVQHVPQMLFHGYSEDMRKHFAVQKNEAARELCTGCKNAKRTTVEILSQGKLAAVTDKYTGNVQLSIIIPSKDNPDILKSCLDAIPTAAGDLPYEIIIVDNGSKEENKQKIEAFVQVCSAGTEQSMVMSDKVKQGKITYLYHPQEFNFSNMCNMGAEAAKGDLLLFLNDDVELAQAGSLEGLAELAVQAYTGAVGIKLYYPDCKRIQHAGITNLPMGPVHKLQFLEDDKEYYFDYNRGCRNVLAVTAACLMVEKKKFDEAGGFSEELRVAFNDVDFCFRLYELGYHNVCRNDCFAYHHESLSRGDDESTEKLNRLLAERDKLYQRHPQLEGVDPYYNRGLGRDGLDTRIRPAYETAGNKLQQSEAALQNINLSEYRQDNCLLFRVEDSREGTVQGYGVVLGDNNACYDRWLVLQKVDCKEADKSLNDEAIAQTAEERQGISPEQAVCHAVAISGQYRPDLMENLPDQTNVGLCGVWVHFSEKNLPAGKYRVGMAVRNRVTGLKLLNWSNRIVEI